MSFDYKYINNNYEWFYYNENMKFIHSIKDDMFQCQSIINACQSNKNTKDWLRNQSTKELINELNKTMDINNIYQKHQKLNIVLRGYYINKLLINHVIIWISPQISISLLNILNDYFKEQQLHLQTKIQSLNLEITEMRPRLVPKNKEKSYHYMIYMEKTDNDASVELHLVRRNHRSFHKTFKDIQKSEKCLYFKDKLPIAMTPNEDIKKLIANNFPMSEYIINSLSIIIYKKHLDKVKDLIINYFEMMQEK